MSNKETHAANNSSVEASTSDLMAKKRSLDSTSPRRDSDETTIPISNPSAYDKLVKREAQDYLRHAPIEELYTVDAVCLCCGAPLSLSSLALQVCGQIELNMEDGEKDTNTKQNTSFIQSTTNSTNGSNDLNQATPSPTNERASEGTAVRNNISNETVQVIGDSFRESTALGKDRDLGLDIQHPLCLDCTEKKINQVKHAITNALEEERAYRALIKSLKRQDRSQKKQAASASASAKEGEGTTGLDGNKNLSPSSLASSLSSLLSSALNVIPGGSGTEDSNTEESVDEVEASELREEISRLIKERREVKRKQAKVHTELANLVSQETECYQKLAELETTLELREEEGRSLIEEIEHSRYLLETLKRSNPFNDAFHIWYDGPFGTINNYRLGRLPMHEVKWTEINAAWGQAALLLASIASKVGHSFKNYRILPIGSYSKIAKIDDVRVSYELFNTDAYFHWGSFNSAMVAYLDCLRELLERAELDRQIPYPVRIEGDHIYMNTGAGMEGYCIRTSSGTDDKWTKALKYVLIALKWLLVWIAKENVAR